MKRTTLWDSLHEEQGATLKHKCGKRDSSIALFIFSFFFLAFLFFFLAFLFFCGFFGHFYFDNLTWDNVLIMMIITLLFTYNSTITTQYLEQNMTLCECLRRCTGMCNDAWVTCMNNYGWWLCHKYDVNYMIMLSNMTMMECVIIKGMVESCMEIYLGMAMEMP